MEILFRAKQTSVRMMRDRGYDVREDVLYLQDAVDQNGTGIPAHTFESFALRRTQFANDASFRESLSFYYLRNIVDPEVDPITKLPIATQELILVKFTGDPEQNKTGKTPMDLFVNELNVNKCKVGIIITPNPLTSDALGEIPKLPLTFIQNFMDIDLTFPIVDHTYTFRHVALKPSAEAAFLRSNKVKKSQLPLLLSEDAISKYYGFQIGQIIKIYRDDLFTTTISPINVTYRLIVRTRATK